MGARVALVVTVCAVLAAAVIVPAVYFSQKGQSFDFHSTDNITFKVFIL
jgi:hypothetical protein